ncbi:MAG: alpha-amylase family glycosyl hydrolase [Roseibacillus sp.]
MKRAGKPERPRIYQLMVRHFGNTCETRTPDGTIEENGCGKFADINDAALRSLRVMGFTHVWLTGVMEHASRTAYPNRPADEPALVKGRAGSPYAIRDYFDVSPDYAVDGERRLEELRELLARGEANGLKVLIDFVPNHVARSYQSKVRPEWSFGNGDQRDVFFRRDNNFYYLSADDPGSGPPLRLPGEKGGLAFAPESEFGLVSGNNVRSWAPSMHDWYETVKLNYGHDFTQGPDTSHLPGAGAPPEEVPDTWRKMDAVLAYWQEFGVAGFRVDMAHMVPMEFWRWALARARERQAGVFFMAEAYDGDPAKLTHGNVLEELLRCGFDAIYDGESYELVQQIYEGPKWANDLDELAWRGELFQSAVRYAENHDEVRVASPLRWGGFGMAVGRAVSAILFGMAKGPVLIYNGQEVGEAAIGAAGFSGGDGRTSIFDYGSLPELAKWVNGQRYDGGALSEEQRELRGWYAQLLSLSAEPAFARGEFVPLNSTNRDNPNFGRIGEESTSGHWLYAFLRIDPETPQTFLVVVNLHGGETMRGIRVKISREGLRRVGCSGVPVRFAERLGSDGIVTVEAEALVNDGLALPDLAPCSVCFLEMEF